MANIPYVDLDFCQFSDQGYTKESRIWGAQSILELSPVKCTGPRCPNVINTSPGAYRHICNPNDPTRCFGMKCRYEVPSKLIAYLMSWDQHEEKLEAMIHHLERSEIKAGTG